MNKTKTQRRLSLTPQTVAVLHDATLALAAGGASGPGSGHASCTDDGGSCRLTDYASRAMKDWTCWA
jgi:hypothetical protein